MQEIALLLSSLAGIATAAAVRARAGGSGQILTLGASSQIQSQIKALRMEKEVLAKTITRLYQAEWEMPREQKEELLARYQRQMGMVMARLEKMEDAKRHPDLGPVGDGLITLMDQKLSGLDAKIYDISSAVADIKAVQQKAIAPGKAEAQGTGGTGGVAAAVAPTAAVAVAPTADTKVVPDMPIPGQKRVRPFEITTLTSIPAAKKPEFRIKTDEKKAPMEAAAAAEQQAATDTPVTQRQEQIQQPGLGLQEQLPVEKPAAVQKEDRPEKESVPVDKEEEEKKMPDVSSLIVPDVGTAIVPKTIPDAAGTKDAAADSPEPAVLHPPAAATMAGGKVTPPKQDEGEAARLAGDDGGTSDGKEEEEDDKELKEAISDIKKTLEKLDRAESE
ncbi:MAG: hypothetical protein OXP12_02335 [Thaumarchaeota archaeon]|nr:hypothetical protein [Nitrososphaerota archaeon]